MDSTFSKSTNHLRMARAFLYLFCLLCLPLSWALFSGVAAADVVSSQGSIDFGYCRIGSQMTKKIWLTNTDSNNTAVVDLQISGDPVFEILGGGEFLTIPAGKSIEVEIAFTPEYDKLYRAGLAVTVDGGAGVPLNIPLSGSGFYQVSDVIKVIGGTLVAFDPCQVGDSSTYMLRLVNTGNVDVTIIKTVPDLYAADATGRVFTLTTANGGAVERQTIPAYGYLETIVTFAPKTVGQQYRTTLEILYDNFAESSEITLVGTGVASPDEVVTVTEQLDFGDCNLGRQKVASLLFFNNGNMDVTVTSVDLPNGAFSCSDLAGKTIPANGVLEAHVTFEPMSLLDFSATMRVLYDAWLPASEILLMGKGTANPEIQVSPGTLDFGTIGLNQEKTQTIVLTNTGDVPVDILKAETGSNAFSANGLTGIIGVGETKVGTVIFKPESMGASVAVLELVFDNMANRGINLSGTGSDIIINPAELNFTGLTVGESATQNLVITNYADYDQEVKGALTATSSFRLKGLEAGVVIPGHGGSITCQVTFHPETSGYLADNIFLNIGAIQDVTIPEIEPNWGAQYFVHLTGFPYVDFSSTTCETFTADRNYRLQISAASPQPGRLYVLLSHDPISQGAIYALAADGSLHPFPYQSPDAWQSLWYQTSTNSGNVLDLSKIDLRQLGCTSCQGPVSNSGAQETLFGNIVVSPPVADYSNAADFKFLEGTLYMGTFVKDPYLSQGRPFRFDEGLLEFQTLNIRSLAGVWRVTSQYYGEDRVHQNLLTVWESDGQISASWPPFPVQARYASDESAYIFEFTYSGFHYIYKIKELSAYRFSGTYSCYYLDQLVEDNSPVSGERVR